MLNRIQEWRARRALSLDALAERAGTTRQQVFKLERGERRLTVDWLLRLSKALEVDPADLLPPEAETPSAGLGPPPAPRSTAAPAPTPRQASPDDQIPIRSAARGGYGQEMFLEDGPIGSTHRPPNLIGVRDAYALYMVGDSMLPRYEPGWLLHINPHKPVRRGRAVAVTCHDNRVLVKLFVGWTGDELVLEQLNPPGEIRLPRAEIRDLHLVVGSDEEG